MSASGRLGHLCCVRSTGWTRSERQLATWLKARRKHMIASISAHKTSRFAFFQFCDIGFGVQRRIKLCRKGGASHMSTDASIREVVYCSRVGTHTRSPAIARSSITLPCTITGLKAGRRLRCAIACLMLVATSSCRRALVVASALPMAEHKNTCV